MEAFFIGAQEGSRYDRFWALSRGVSIPLVGGLFPPPERVHWETLGARLGGSGERARESREGSSGKGRGGLGVGA